MRKVYTFLASAFLMVLGATTVKAQQYYDVQGFPESKLQELTPGQSVVLQPASQGATAHYFSGQPSSTTANSKTIYTFEQAEEQVDGQTAYLLKQVETGLYLQDIDYTNNQIKFATSKAKAQPLFVKQAVTISYKGENIPEDADWTTTCIYDSAHYNKVAPEGAFVISLANHPKTYLNSYWGNSNAFLQYQDTNTWYLYAATKQTGVARLEKMLYELFPNGAIDKYTVGEDVGQVPQAAVDKLQHLYDECNEAIENSAEEAQANALADKLWDGYQEYLKAVITVHTGYFYIRDGRDGEKNYVYDHNGVMDFVQNYDLPEEVTPQSAKYVWYLEEKDGKFLLKNFATNKYANEQKKGNYYTTQDNGSLWEIVPNAKFNGKYNIQLGNKKGMWNTYRHAVTGIGEWNDYADPGSVWRFTPVKESALQAVKDAAAKDLAKSEQKARNNKMGDLLRQSEEAINAGYAYDVVGANNKTAEGFFTYSENGLIQDPGQISTNAQEKTEGPKENLTDNNADTFFHSTWHASDSIKEYHYLQFELQEPVQGAEFQILKRKNANGELKEIQVVAAENAEGPWVNQGYYSVNFNQNAIMPKADGSGNDTLRNSTAVVGFQMDKPYSFIRLIAIRNGSNGLTNGYPWMHMAELRLYKANRSQQSINSAIDQQVLNNLQAAMVEGKTQLSDSTVTQATVEKLVDALKAYREATPQPQEVKDRIAALEKIYASTEEGEGLGYYQAGAKATFKAAIDEVKEAVKPVMTVEEVKAQLAKLNTALDAYNAKLNIPENGKIYRIQSADPNEKSKVYKNYLYAQNNDASPVKAGGRSDEGVEDANLPNRLNFYWKFIKNNDGTCSFMNVGTGTYLGDDQTKRSNPIKMRLQSDSISFKIGSAKPGTFNFRLYNDEFMHLDPQRNLVMWFDGNTERSQYTFVPVQDEEWSEQQSIINVESKAFVKTLPYAIEADAIDGKLYYALGIKDKKLQLKQFTDVIPAGTPFIVIPDDKDKKIISLTVANEPTLSTIEYTQEAKTYAHENAGQAKKTILQGTLKSVDVPVGNYYINNAGTMLLKVEEASISGANDGWFTSMSNTTEDGDIAIKVDPDLLEEVSTGIVNVDVVKSTNNKIYDLQGRQVKKAVKGVYIINGKKVVK